MAGAVAVGTVERWTGVYDEAGSEPGTLGRALWSLLVQMRARGEGLEELRFLMERHGRWEVIAHARGLTQERPSDRTPIRVLSSVVDPRFVTWVYVVDPVAGVLTVLATSAETAAHVPVAVVPLPPGDEPDWTSLGR